MQWFNENSASQADCGIAEWFRSLPKSSVMTAWRLMASGLMTIRSTGRRLVARNLQRLALGEGIEIHGVAANNDFCNYSW